MRETHTNSTGELQSATHQQEEVRLCVVLQGDSVKEHLLFPGLPLHKISHILSLTTGDAEHFQPLPVRAQERPASPHDGVWLHNSCSSGQLLNPSWPQLFLHTTLASFHDASGCERWSGALPRPLRARARPVLVRTLLRCRRVWPKRVYQPSTSLRFF